MLKVLSPGTIIKTAESDGVYNIDKGNLFPFKVHTTHWGVNLYIDDGHGDHGEISNEWTPLDEFVKSPIHGGDGSKTH